MAKKKTNKPTDAVRSYLSGIGKKGGLTKGPSKARDPEKMRAAVNKRWEAYRAKKAAEEQETPPPEAED